MKLKVKSDALSLVALAEVDIYSKVLPFTYGLACPMTQVGISTIYRYKPEFTGEEYGDEEEMYNKLLYRAL